MRSLQKHTPLLQLKQISVKFWEENIAVELGHDVGQVHQVTPRVIQRSLSTNNVKKTSKSN